MPDHCCVPNCKSNYKGTEEYFSVFKFPKSTEERELWMKKIPRADFIPGPRAVVCEKHFGSTQIIRHDELPVKGEIIKIVRKVPKLTKGAYPTIFPDCPKYLSEEKPCARKSRDEKIKEKDDNRYASFLNADKILSFHEFNEKISSGEYTKDLFTSCHGENVYILFIQWTPSPKISKSIELNSSMQLTICVNNIQINYEKYSHIVTKNILSRWSELVNIISFVKNFEDNDVSEYDLALHHWKRHVDMNPFDDVYCSQDFILEQIKLFNLSKMAKRYSNNLITLAYSLFIKSASCYGFLVASNLLSLPSLDHLRRISFNLSINQSTLSESNIKYLKIKSKKLQGKEKIVNLLIDEVHIKPKIEYKGKCLKGFAENKTDSDTEATSIQSFMIISLFCNFKEIIGLVPVTRLTTDELLKLCIQALELLDKCEFQVLSIISDNNRINRNMFTKFQIKDLNNCLYINPINSQDLHLLFDPVHLIKSIRNNWIHQNDAERSFMCPNFSNENDFIRVSFDKLRKLHNIEKRDNLKLAPKLSFKTLYPSNIEKQNVKLALNVFHESSIVALETISTTHNYFQGTEETISFLKLIKKWWDICNVSNPKKGIFTRNLNSYPFMKDNDERLTFLLKFSEWLKKWKALKQKPKCGCLSEETFFALTHTSLSLAAVIKYCLVNLNFSYVLTSKFQTDCLESRFSVYRQMCGGNYHVSLQQVLETERKLKIESLLNLRSEMYGDIPVQLFLSSISVDKIVDVSEFESIIDNLNFDMITDKDMSILNYIGGYCIHKLNIICESCQLYFFNDNDVEIILNRGMFLLSKETKEYLNLIDRGGLKTPSTIVVCILTHCYAVFQKLLSEEFESKFLSAATKQHSLVIELMKLLISEENLIDVNFKCQECQTAYLDIMLKILSTFVNICLNNYTKVKLNQHLFSANERKLKKFKS